MGQLRQAHCPVRTKPIISTLRTRMLPPLLAGFMLSSSAIFALTSVAGSTIRSTLWFPTDLVVVLALMLCATTDLLFPRLRPTLFNRQTSRKLSRMFSAPFTGLLWGMDAGTVVSTYRTSAASWAALTLVFAGWGPWWTGVVYGAAFSVPLGLLIGTYPVTGEADGALAWRAHNTEALVSMFVRRARYLRIAAAVAAGTSVVLAFQGSAL
jgi:hypothetical protein